MRLYSVLSLFALAAAVVRIGAEVAGEHEQEVDVTGQLHEQEVDDELHEDIHRMLDDGEELDQEGLEDDDQEDFNDVLQADEDLEPLSPTQIRGLHAKFDSNGDGKASFAEIMAYATTTAEKIAERELDTYVAELDKSGDGQLSIEELNKDRLLHPDSEAELEEGEPQPEMYDMISDLEKEKFKLADADHNGLLDKKEIHDFFHHDKHGEILSLLAKDTMTKMDLDHDQHLNLAEFEAATDERDPTSPTPDESDFRSVDKNGDGRISLEELKTWEKESFHREESLRKMLEAADKDHDEHVTADELEAAREEIQTNHLDAHFHLWDFATKEDL